MAERLAKVVHLARLVVLFAVMLDAQDTGSQALGFQPEERFPALVAS